MRDVLRDLLAWAEEAERDLVREFGQGGDLAVLDGWTLEPSIANARTALGLEPRLKE